ncbi:kinase-like domain-containing protein [Gigaspora rosea]|uniref:Kinase-like domain-containing protein n=1 Tax=Gigaspora rosea TaxID=44941 RepID=A0A397V738_9GLOM|nr:kinase-like domain-containing protein [Gigaspora rosea]
MGLLEEFMNYIKSDELKVYGLTQNTATNEYMLAFDKFHSKRSYESGNCVYCKQYNTSKAWCQTCDPQRTTRGWTSGNKNIDDCIKEFQLKSTEYENVIEWIPFNRLNNIQEIDKFGYLFQATWLDGKRSTSGPARRKRPYLVELKVLSDSQNPLDFLKEFTYQMQTKNDIKIYGITQPTTGKYMMVFESAINGNENDAFASKRQHWHGKCTNCNRFNTSTNWCQSCDPYRITQEWTSGNKDIDDCIKEFQLNATEHKKAIEWIPFDKLNIIKKIGEGGFGTVFLAKLQQNTSQSIKVALKTLPVSKENSNEFLREFKSHMNCRLSGSRLEVYGLTQNTKTKEYMMVFQYANKGDLHNYLKLKFEELTWADKLSLLIDISKDLIKIHEAGYIHCDLHCGNILQHEEWLGSLKSYIADLGLSRKDEERIDGIYGIMPYIAPEILLGQKYTPAADIYSFGVIMAEITTGIRPFCGRSFDIELALEICNGTRPVSALETPSCYIELAKLCMNSDSQKRPTAKKICDKLSEWHSFVNRPDEFDESDELDETNKLDEFDESDESNKELQIINEFMVADMRIPELSITLKEQHDIIYRYASKFINTHDIAQQYKERNGQIGSIPVNSAEIPVDVTISHRSKRLKTDQGSYTTRD